MSVRIGSDTPLYSIGGSTADSEERIKAIEEKIEIFDIGRMRLNEPDLLSFYDQIIEQAHKMISKLRNQSYLSEDVDRDLEEKIALFQQQYTLHLKKECLKVRFQEDYPLILRQAEILCLYKGWEIQFEEKCEAIKTAYPNRDTVSTALRVKELLYSEKEMWFSSFFRSPRSASQGINCAYAIDSTKQWAFDRKKLQGVLSVWTEESRSRITSLEEKLVRPIGWRSSMAASLLRLATTHPRAMISSHLVDSVSTIVGAQLKTTIPSLLLTVVKVVSTLFLIVWDLFLWWWVGLYHSLLRTVSRHISPSMISCIGPWKQLGSDEKTVAKYFPVVHEIIESMLYVSVQRYFDRESPIVEIAVHYTVVRVSQWAVAFFVRRCYQVTCKKGERAEHSMTYPLVSFVAQLGSTYFTEYYAWPYARAEWYRIAACRSLGVYPTANKEAIHRAYRMEARKWHPDNKKTGDVARFRLLKRAKERCLKGVS